jgi:hypothetical protein
MDTSHRSFPILDQQLFTQLLTNTLGVAHGRFPLLQEDDQGAVWEIVMPALSAESSKRLLWEAMGKPKLHDPPCLYHQYGCSLPALPKAEEFIIFSGDTDDHLFALCASGNYYVLRTDGPRYYQLVLRGKYHSDASRVLNQTLRKLYGTISVPPTVSANEEERPIIAG